MRNRLFCNQPRQPRAINRNIALILFGLGCILAHAPKASAGGDAPQWMHALVNVTLPAHDEKTDAVLLYSEENVMVQSADKIKKVIRVAYKILRPGGRERGTVFVYFNSHRKITSLHGWCIPAQGKDYEVKDKDAMEVSLPKIEGSELITDVKDKVLRIPSSDPGNIIGYEYEVEEQPMVLQDIWYFQEENPGRESHYSLQLPPNWEYKAMWLNYPEVKPSQAGSREWHWVVSDLKAIRKEDAMPPMAGVAGQMIVSFFPQGGAALNGFANWQQMGNWYRNLTNGRLDASAGMKQRVTTLTSLAPTQLDKIRAVAQFVQQDIRYVAIELGIGGWQPHPASDVFLHHYGDCKDKATLMSSMLREIGVDSYYVVINHERGSVGPEVPPHVGAFDHMILAIKLPEGMADPSLIATIQSAHYGRLLFFDPTNEFTPLGQIGGYLQSNYGLLVMPDGGELVELPKQPSTMNSIQRTAKLTLENTGKLQGEVNEVRMGDRARSERWQLRAVAKDSDRIKPIERLLADSLSTFRITKASVVNLQHTDQPFGFNYSFESENYAKSAGNLLLVRPRVIGTKSRGLLETKEPRYFSIEFDGPARDTDTFEITVPAGYEVDDLPPPVDAEYSFASYHSKTEVKGNVIGYTRTFEVKELSVPASKAEELKKFYRIIASDERNNVVLRPSR
ncbi:MAG: hypothetical protein DMG75_01050 [Acidobacteria bacterium]|nr:MAG: hypothetical protein DMG75_01050 [Acidobacteriota bacterium]